MNATTQEFCWQFMTYMSQKQHIISYLIIPTKTLFSFLNMIHNKETIIILILSATLPNLELDNHVKEKVISLFKKLLKL